MASELLTSDDKTPFVEVSQNVFYRAIGPLNVSPRVMGDYPYRSDFVTPHGEVMGQAQDGDPDRYYLARKLT